MTPLTESAAEAYVASVCFKIGPPRLAGVELEWFVADPARPAAPVDQRRVAAALADACSAGAAPLAAPPATALPGGSRITREPGGQVELSSPPAASLADCADTALGDLSALRAAFLARGLRLVGTGTAPRGPRRRVLREPRYAAMERFFGRGGPWGRVMMCSTASVQPCLDAGTDGGGPDGFRARWHLAHLLGPVLVGVFAHSPLLSGHRTGWRSTRQAVWSRLDAGRTLAPGTGHGDPREEWARYVLDAEVMCVRRPDGLPWTAPAGLTFRDWLRGAGERPPTLADLDYHRTTLFPPVRPQGHLELRMIDAQPGDGWLVPLALTTALLDDPVAADAARAALEQLAGACRCRTPAPRGELWRRAARDAMTDPALRQAALVCFAAADGALARLGAPPALRYAVADFADRYPARGRCPADDVLDALTDRASRPHRQETAPC